MWVGYRCYFWTHLPSTSTFHLHPPPLFPKSVLHLILHCPHYLLSSPYTPQAASMVGHGGHQLCNTCSQHIFDDNPLVRSARAQHVCHVCHWHAPDCESLVVHWQFSGHLQVCKCCTGAFVAPAEIEHHLLQYFGCARCHCHHGSPEELVKHKNEEKFPCNTCGIKGV